MFDASSCQYTNAKDYPSSRLREALCFLNVRRCASECWPMSVDAQPILFAHHIHRWDGNTTIHCFLHCCKFGQTAHQVRKEGPQLNHLLWVSFSQHIIQSEVDIVTVIRKTEIVTICSYCESFVRSEFGGVGREVLQTRFHNQNTVIHNSRDLTNSNEDIWEILQHVLAARKGWRIPAH